MVTVRGVFLLVVIIMAGCRTGEIACPEPETVKLKRNHFFAIRKPRKRDETLARNDPHANYYRQEREEDYKKFIDIEEWDCPRPDAARNRRIARNHRKAQEKKAKADEKRKREMNSDGVSVIPESGQR